MCIRPTAVLFLFTFLTPTLAQEPTTLRPCTRGPAHRVIRRDEPNHVIVSVQVAPGDDGKDVVATWRRILQRISDVRVVDAPVESDLAIFVGAREIKDTQNNTIGYVWTAKAVLPWQVACEDGQLYLEQPQAEFMNYASTLEVASEMIQKSVNSIEDRNVQKIRDEKRK